MAHRRLDAAIMAPTAEVLDQPERKTPALVALEHLPARDGTMASQDRIKSRRNHQQKCSLFLLECLPEEHERG